MTNDGNESIRWGEVVVSLVVGFILGWLFP